MWRRSAAGLLLLASCGGPAFRSAAGPGDGGGTTDAPVGANLDGGATADATTDAPAGPFCVANPGHAACFDFEDSVFPPAGLAPVEVNTNPLFRDTTVPPTAALHARTPATDGNTSTKSALQYALSRTVRSIRLQLDVYLVAAQKGWGELTGLFVGSGFEVYFLLEDGHLKLGRDRTGATTETSDLGVMPIGRWVTLQMQIDLAAQTAAVTKLDGSPATVQLGPAPATPVDTGVLLGIEYVNVNTSAVDVLVDNVLIDTR